GIDLYNASDARPDENTLEWPNAQSTHDRAAIPTGWQVRPEPTPIPALAGYRVQRFTMDAQIDPSRISNIDRRPIEFTFTNGFTNEKTRARMILPVAGADRHPPGLSIDGSLEDWGPDDCIQNGPLVQMF